MITVDEEIGMLGAEAIDLSMLKGHKLLNIDSDVEGHFVTSCAGGMTVETTIPVDRMSQNGLAVTLTVTEDFAADIPEVRLTKSMRMPIWSWDVC